MVTICFTYYLVTQQVTASARYFLDLKFTMINMKSVTNKVCLSVLLCPISTTASVDGLFPSLFLPNTHNTSTSKPATWHLHLKPHNTSTLSPAAPSPQSPQHLNLNTTLKGIGTCRLTFGTDIDNKWGSLVTLCCLLGTHIGPPKYYFGLTLRLRWGYLGKTLVNHNGLIRS